jgi:hypothetical protein
MPRRIRPARHYQRSNDPARRLFQSERPRIARAIRENLQHLPDLVPAQKIRNLLATGRWHQIQYAVDFPHFAETLKGAFARIAEAYQDGARLGVRRINGAFGQAQRRVRFRKGLGDYLWKQADVFNFDMFDSATQAKLRQAQDNLIQQLTTDARDTIEAIVMDGVQRGLGAAEIVDDVRAMVGLTDTQARAVLNYRAMLEGLDSTALQRQLRNSDWDALVGQAISSGEALAQDKIDQMVADYTENYLDYRASTIAQTESVRAISTGLTDAYRQAVDRGALPEGAVKRRWQLGDSPCPICESIPDNNPEGVGVNEAFVSDEGPVDDPPVHPNCMCSVDFLTDISQVPEINPESGQYDTAGYNPLYE